MKHTREVYARDIREGDHIKYGDAFKRVREVTGCKDNNTTRIIMYDTTVMVVSSGLTLLVDCIHDFRVTLERDTVCISCARCDGTWSVSLERIVELLEDEKE